MAEREIITGENDTEGCGITLTKDNYPRCLFEQDKVETIEGCMQLVAFLKEAVAGMLVVEREEGLPSGIEGDRISLG